jgi:NAD-dependent DNA ligase
VSPVSDEQPATDERVWPTHCPACGTELETMVTGFNPAGQDDIDHHTMGEVVARDFCPNPDCPTKAAT